MKTRYSLLGVGVLAGMLAACGGGGGGGGTPPPTTPPSTPTPASTLAPNPYGCVGVNSVAKHAPLAPAFVGVHPISNGDTYTYSGTLTQTVVRSSPCPMPTATSNATVTVAVTETTQPSQPASTQTEHSVETDAFALNTTVLTTDAIVKTVGTGFFETGETATDQGGNKVATTFGSGNGLQFAQVPESSANTWTNVSPTVVNSTLSDGSTYARVYSAAGAYTETDTLPGATNKITVNSDGSGSYVLGYGKSSAITVAVAAPSAGSITLTLTGVGPSPVPKTVTSWLPNPVVLYRDATQDNGVQPISSTCGNLSPIGNPTSAEQQVRTLTINDPVLGYNETRTVTTWDTTGIGSTAANVTGPICAVISDTEKLYYDYTFVTPFLIAIASNGTPVQTTTIAETIFLNAQPTNNSVGRGTGATSLLNAHLAGIDFARAVERAQRMESITQAARAARHGGAL